MFAGQRQTWVYSHRHAPWQLDIQGPSRTGLLSAATGCSRRQTAGLTATERPPPRPGPTLCATQRQTVLRPGAPLGAFAPLRGVGASANRGMNLPTEQPPEVGGPGFLSTACLPAAAPARSAEPGPRPAFSQSSGNSRRAARGTPRLRGPAAASPSPAECQGRSAAPWPWRPQARQARRALHTCVGPTPRLCFAGPEVRWNRSLSSCRAVSPSFHSLWQGGCCLAQSRLTLQTVKLSQDPTQCPEFPGSEPGAPGVRAHPLQEGHGFRWQRG